MQVVAFILFSFGVTLLNVLNLPQCKTSVLGICNFLALCCLFGLINVSMHCPPRGTLASQDFLKYEWNLPWTNTFCILHACKASPSWITPTSGGTLSSPQALYNHGTLVSKYLDSWILRNISICSIGLKSKVFWSYMEYW